mmetsp:Transcript_32072/g.77557  ORF Transcript_32072/g.77557 Transcript_32072/m.77557 type:complete len:330 (+) Transcript_32072:150-1139(+)
MSLRRNPKPMPPQYRTISPGGDAVPFELEDEHIRRNEDGPNRQKLPIVVTCLVALLVAIVGYSVYKGGGERPPPALSTDALSKASTSADNISRMIFCYGDSLTFGMVPGSKEPFPYALYLQRELNYLFDSTSSASKEVEPTLTEAELQTKQPATIVQHLGLPGWTATSMLNHINDKEVGLCNIIYENPTLSLMIILAGTNDIGQMSNTSKDAARSIVQSIVGLHQSAFECAKDAKNYNFHTVAMSIPGAAFEEAMPVLSELSSYVNESVKQFATESDGKVTYIEFPFPYDEDDEKWSEDGIHLSQEGYNMLGKALAPQVKVILEGIHSL